MFFTKQIRSIFLLLFLMGQYLFGSNITIDTQTPKWVVKYKTGPSSYSYYEDFTHTVGREDNNDLSNNYGDYAVWRTAYQFDLTDIEDDAIITSAHLYVSCGNYSEQGWFHIKKYNGDFDFDSISDIWNNSATGNNYFSCERS